MEGRKPVNLDSGDRGAGLYYNVQLSIRVNRGLLDRVEMVSEWQVKKRSEMIRDWVREGIERALRNPEFKRWLKLQRSKGRYL